MSPQSPALKIGLHVPPKRRLIFSGIHGVIPQVIEHFITTGVRTSSYNDELCSCEILVHIYQTVLRYNPKDHNMNLHRLKNLSSHVLSWLYADLYQRYFYIFFLVFQLSCSRETRLRSSACDGHVITFHKYVTIHYREHLKFSIPRHFSAKIPCAFLASIMFITWPVDRSRWPV
jgi:hypothetical protein